MKNLKLVGYSSALSVMLLGCSDSGLLNSQSKEINVPLGSVVEIMKDDKVIFTDNPKAGVEVNILTISDSRCPSDVVCVWEGNVKVGFQLGFDKDSIYLCLPENVQGCEQTRVVYFEGQQYMLELIDVSPYPTSTNGKEKKKVKFQLRALLIRN